MSDSPYSIIAGLATAATNSREAFLRDRAGELIDLARGLAVALAGGGRILFCGNGPEALLGQYLAALFVHPQDLDRPPLPAQALTPEVPILAGPGTAQDFEEAYARQVRALGRPGDVLLCLAASAVGGNLERAAQEALRRGLTVRALVSGDCEGLRRYCPEAIQIPVGERMAVLETMLSAGHLLCRLAGHFLFEAVIELRPHLNRKP